MREKEEMIIWPQYLDKELSVSEGRKVPLEYAVKDPTVNKIEKALKRLGIKCITEKDKAYPGKWYEKSGRVLVSKEHNKNELLKKIGSEFKNMKR